MTILTKINIVGVILIILIVLGLAIDEDATFEVNPNFIDGVPSNEDLEDTLYIDPFEFDPDIILGPPAIVQDDCVDTDNLNDISCADQEAIVKFRKAMAAELSRRLKKETDQLLDKAIQDKYGLQEC